MRRRLNVVDLQLMLLAPLVVVYCAGCQALLRHGVRCDTPEERLAHELRGLKAFAIADGGLLDDRIWIRKRFNDSTINLIEMWLSTKNAAVKTDPTFDGFWLLILKDESGLGKIVKINRGNGSYWVYNLKMKDGGLFLGELLVRIESIWSPPLYNWLATEFDDVGHAFLHESPGYGRKLE